MMPPIRKGWRIRSRSCPRLAWCAPPDRLGRCFAAETRSNGTKVPALVPVQPHGLVYPEWDYRLKGYRSRGAIVRRAGGSARRRGVGGGGQGASRKARAPRASPLRAPAPSSRQAESATGRLRARHRRLGQHLRRHSRRHDRRRSPVCRAPALAPRAGGRAAGRRQRLHRWLGLVRPAHRRRREGSAARGVRGPGRAR